MPPFAFPHSSTAMKSKDVEFKVVAENEKPVRRIYVDKDGLLRYEKVFSGSWHPDTPT